MSKSRNGRAGAFNGWPRMLAMAAAVGFAGCASEPASPPEIEAPPAAAPAPPRAERPSPPTAAERAEVIGRFADTFAGQFRSRANTAEAQHRLVLAVNEPTGRDAAPVVDAFCRQLVANKAFDDEVRVIRLAPGTDVSTLTSAGADLDDAQRRPDGTAAQPRELFHPDVVYVLDAAYSESTKGRDGIVCAMSWRVTHPRSRELILSQRQKQSLTWTNGRWAVVDADGAADGAE